MFGLVGLLLGASVLLGSTEQLVLPLPYRSQLDGSAYAGANCGPTSLSMVLAYYGIDASPWELRVKSMKAQHSWVDDEGGYSDGYGVFVYNLASVGEAYGLRAAGLWRTETRHVDVLREWQAGDLRQQISAGRPVIVQVLYRALPSATQMGYLEDHYIVVHGLQEDGFVYSDPLDGPGQVISERGLSRAMALASNPRVGFALARSN
jgi:uncharacterized protein YvpB